MSSKDRKTASRARQSLQDPMRYFDQAAITNQALNMNA
jgi:hypothetical protein